MLYSTIRFFLAISLLVILPQISRAEGLLRIGLQLHNEPQTNRPCSGPNARLDYLSTCVVMDSLMEVFARHGAKITFEWGLGNAQSTPIWGGPAVRGSVPYMLTRPDVIGLGTHIHFPADFAGFRDRFCPVAPEDTIPEAALTYAQYEMAARRRHDLQVNVAGVPVNGVCGLWSSRSVLRWLPALSAVGYQWVTGWNNTQPEGGSTGGHAWMTAVNPWRAGHDLTNTYLGGVMDNFHDGPIVILPDGAVSGRMNPNENCPYSLIDSLIYENWLASDPERINLCYLTVHDYEFKSGPNIDYFEFREWDTLLTLLDQHVAAGRAVYQTFDEMYEDFVEWESQGNISYPPNGNFETRDTTVFWQSPGGPTEILEFNSFWAALDGLPAAGDGRSTVVHRGGRASYHFGTDPNLRGIGPSTSQKHIYAVVPPDSIIELRAWCRVSGSATPRLGFRWYDAPDTSVGYPHLLEQRGGFTDSVSGEWRLLKYRAQVPSGASALRTCLYKSGDGEVWFDDVNTRYVAAVFDPILLTLYPDGGHVRLRWTVSPGAEAYRVHYDSLATGNFSGFHSFPATDTTAVFELSPTQSRMFFRVRAWRAD